MNRPEYVSWYGMKHRCLNKNDTHYKYYGARGITICERWLNFENFLADMGKRPQGTTLDRINNDGNYEPGNCRWADYFQQNQNSRLARLVTLDGISKTVSEWGRTLGVSHQVISNRLKRGCPPKAELVGKKPVSSNGGIARALALSPERRAEIARKMMIARLAKAAARKKERK